MGSASQLVEQFIDQFGTQGEHPVIVALPHAAFLSRRRGENDAVLPALHGQHHGPAAIAAAGNGLFRIFAGFEYGGLAVLCRIGGTLLQMRTGKLQIAFGHIVGHGKNLFAEVPGAVLLHEFAPKLGPTGTIKPVVRERCKLHGVGRRRFSAVLLALIPFGIFRLVLFPFRHSQIVTKQLDLLFLPHPVEKRCASVLDGPGDVPHGLRQCFIGIGRSVGGRRLLNALRRVHLARRVQTGISVLIQPVSHFIETLYGGLRTVILKGVTPRLRRFLSLGLVPLRQLQEGFRLLTFGELEARHGPVATELGIIPTKPLGTGQQHKVILPAYPVFKANYEQIMPFLRVPGGNDFPVRGLGSRGEGRLRLRLPAASASFRRKTVKPFPLLERKQLAGLGSRLAFHMETHERPEIIQRFRVLDGFSLGLAAAGILFTLFSHALGKIHQRLLALGIHNPADAGFGALPIRFCIHAHHPADGIGLPKREVRQHVPIQGINNIGLPVPLMTPRKHGAATFQQFLDGHAGQFGANGLLILQQVGKAAAVFLKSGLSGQKGFVEIPVTVNPGLRRFRID